MIGSIAVSAQVLNDRLTNCQRDMEWLRNTKIEAIKPIIYVHNNSPANNHIENNSPNIPQRITNFY